MTLTPQEQQQLSEFLAGAGITIQNFELLREALTHRSFINEAGNKLPHNERLEFLGDAVLELITTEFLFQKYPNRPEGDMTSFRSALVRTESLAEIAGSLNYGKYIYMSRGEEATGGRQRPYILANTFEAIIGALYLDQGYDACRDFIQKVLFPKTDSIVEKRLDIDSKSKLQELAQDLAKQTPTYILKTASGPDHDKSFTMAVTIGETEFGEGSGRSKQEAEQRAAKSALDNWEKQYQTYKKSVKISPSND